MKFGRLATTAHMFHNPRKKTKLRVERAQGQIKEAEGIRRKREMAIGASPPVPFPVHFVCASTAKFLTSFLGGAAEFLPFCASS